jgi:hypothetical protein
MNLKFKQLRENIAARMVSMAVKHTTPKKKSTSILAKEEPKIGDGVYIEFGESLIETEIVGETEDGYVLYLDEEAEGMLEKLPELVFGKDTMDSMKRLRQWTKDKEDPKKRAADTAEFWNKQLEKKDKKVSEDASKYMDTKPVSVTSKQASEYDDAAKRAFKPKYYEKDTEPAPPRKSWDYDDPDVKPIVNKYLNDKILDKKPLTAPTPSESVDITEAEYQGKDVPLNKPMSGDVAKSKVYVKGPSGRVVKVNFGDKNLSIKKHIPARRKSFRARHRCETPGPKHKARYWSCKAW